MTAQELRDHFNRVYGIEHPWPKTYEVDAETYANCCQAVFDWFIEHKEIHRLASNEERGNYYMIHLPIGLNGGLKFKGVELILKP